MQIIPYDATKQTKRKKALPRSTSEWQTHKHKVRELHRQGYTLKAILKYLRDHCDFEVTARQLWAQVSVWGLTRYNKGVASRSNGNDDAYNFSTQQPDSWKPSLLPVWPSSRPRVIIEPAYQQNQTKNPVFASLRLSLYLQHAYSWDLRSLGDTDEIKCVATTCKRSAALPSEALENLLSSQDYSQESSVSSWITNLLIDDDTLLELWLARYGTLLDITRACTSLVTYHTLASLSWLFLFVYELAFTSALLAKHELGRHVFSLDEIQTHLGAAARLLGMMKAADRQASISVAGYIRTYEEFDQRLENTDIVALDSSKTVLDERMPCTVERGFSHAPEVPAQIYLIVQREGPHEYIALSNAPPSLSLMPPSTSK